MKLQMLPLYMRYYYSTTAAELKENQLFKTPKQRYYRYAAKVFVLDGTNIPEKDKAKILVCLPNCQQLIFSPDTELFVRV